MEWMDGKALAMSATVSCRHAAPPPFSCCCRMPFTVIFFIGSTRVCVDGHTQTVVPTTNRSCVKSRQCITSAWSPWAQDAAGPCNQHHRRVGRLTRHRRIEQLPHGSGGQACPHLVEYKPLPAQLENATSCQPQYQLVASGWSNCRVVDLNGNVGNCGGGLEERNISCLSLKENRLPQPVDLGFCSHLPQLPRLQR